MSEAPIPAKQPWASGPAEILQHGIDLLQIDSDANRRLAMLAIDNAVELTIKTFLTRPSRVSKLGITRADLNEINESFPKLLDALEKHASDKLEGIDLGVIEWYHRLRNELYHQGNGLTVVRQKVIVYAQLARLLFQRLFDFDLTVQQSPTEDLVQQFLAKFAELEGLVGRLSVGPSTTRSEKSPEHSGSRQGNESAYDKGYKETSKTERDTTLIERIIGSHHYKTTISDRKDRVEGLGRTPEEAEERASGKWGECDGDRDGRSASKHDEGGESEVYQDHKKRDSDRTIGYRSPIDSSLEDDIHMMRHLKARFVHGRIDTLNEDEVRVLESVIRRVRGNMWTRDAS